MFCSGPDQTLSDKLQFVIAHISRPRVMTREIVQGLLVASLKLSFKYNLLNILRRLRMVGLLLKNLYQAIYVLNRFRKWETWIHR